MSISQLSIFDYDINIQSNDCIFQQLLNLQDGQTVQVAEMQITRDSKFFTVKKTKEFEELFHDIHFCYRFINNNLSNDQKRRGNEGGAC
ncbi:hypothetical protein QUF65_17430 [Lysinibacillus sphaericus]|uniref:hypothetical protein n=1 Tax=Lysinibacillus sphaericus TaxID=1421 RepID=UPI0025A10B5F|nr:hypothetical protein [Lysinibacillus sphaericus]MDM5352611.1 hypothetical protein [Lysinibacillus sphaericus]